MDEKYFLGLTIIKLLCLIVIAMSAYKISYEPGSSYFKVGQKSKKLNF